MSVCNILVSTYNTNILETTTEKEKKIFKDICNSLNKKKNNKQKFKKILATLIYNHFNLKKPNYKYISGPLNCTLWKSTLYDKNIYIFGELHGIEENCSNYYLGNIEIQNYFKQLFNTTDVFIDFYLEIFNYKNVDKNNTSYMTELRRKFKDCINPDKRKNPECDLTRMHYTDVRFADKKQLYIDKIEVESTKYLDFIHSNTPIQNYFIRLVNLYIGPKKDVINFFIKKFKNRALKILKNERSVLYREIHNFIITRLISWINNIYETMNACSINIKKYFITNDNISLLSDIENIKYTTIRIFTLTMDFYLLCRIFKTFKVKEIDKDQPNEPKNIIIYAGELHASTYRAFFNFLGFKNTEKTGITHDYKNILNKKIEIFTKNKGERCLDMSGIKQPLFNF